MNGSLLIFLSHIKNASNESYISDHTDTVTFMTYILKKVDNILK